MEAFDRRIFSSLFHQAYVQCFQVKMEQPLNETEAKRFYQQIMDQTGLVIGWRSLKNYSLFLLNVAEKPENPSMASLDTLARYVSNAPCSDEAARKKDDGLYTFWYRYRAEQLKIATPNPATPRPRPRMLQIVAAILLSGCLAATSFWFLHTRQTSFSENFHNVSDAGLTGRGWTLLAEEPAFWSKRNATDSAITLFTLPGDNWPDSNHKPSIRNLLIRALPDDCFTAELHMRDFMPASEWQQAGLLLMEDSSLAGRSIRLSLAFNDFFGGFQKSGEVIIQSIYEAGVDQKPEEFIHFPVLNGDSLIQNPALRGAVKNTAFRIERQQNQYRFLYSGGVFANGAFRELAIKSFPFRPNFIGIFAISGFKEMAKKMPVTIKQFSLEGQRCQ